MELSKDSTQTQYAADLNNVEAQIIRKEDTVFLIKKDDDICMKICVSIFVTLICSPFAICDLYYATTDTTCVTQSQRDHNLNIILQSYLLASGIITFVLIGISNVYVFTIDLNSKDNNNDDIIICCGAVSSWILRVFNLAWLILGCVLFWGYTDISTCSQTVHDYLFARFIIFLVFTAFSASLGESKK